MTPRMHTTAWLSKTLSSCLALSPHNVTTMLVAVSSAIVISRLINSLPSFEVKDKNGLKAVITPQSSTVHGSVFDCNVLRSIKP